MPRRRALPYRFDEEELELKITEVIVGGGPLGNRIKEDKLTVELQDQKEWPTGEVHIEARVHEHAEENLIPEDERSNPPWKIDATLLCREAKWRNCISLDCEKDGVWRGVIPLHRSELSGTLSIRAFLIRTHDRQDAVHGFASKANVRLASSKEWKIYADDPQTAPGEYLEVEWINFATSNKDRIQDFSSHIYYLDFGENPPVLYINSGVAGLKDALESRATRGAPAAVRDVLFDSIAQNVWTALAMNAVLSARNEDGEEQSLDDWQKNVLGKFGTKLMGRFQDITHTARNPSEVPALLEEIISAVQGQVDMRKSTNKLLKLLIDR